MTVTDFAARLPTLDASRAGFDLSSTGRTMIMGILNVTPDSFSDGGRWLRLEDAVTHALEMAETGADIIDVGGESFRPGAHRISPAEEQSRVLPVLRELAKQAVPMSIDTVNSSTAQAAIDAGAVIINDVSGGLADPQMIEVVSRLDVPYIVSHWRGHRGVAFSESHYGDVVEEVCAELTDRITELVKQGVTADRLVIDPGLGFAKASEHNWKILAHFESLKSLGFPVLVGASRKRFVGSLLPPETPVCARDLPSTVIAALAAQSGAWAVRVHDVPATRVALDVVDAWRRGADE